MKNFTLLLLGLILGICTCVSGEEPPVECWAARYNGPGNGHDIACAIAVDNSGNVYVTGESYDSNTSNDYATIKYNANGNQLWVARYTGPGEEWDGAYAIAVDDSGNAYVAGTIYDSNTSDDYATIKYNPDGTQLWVRTYNGPADGDDCVNALAIDSSGNVYVTGESYDSNTDNDYATIKYSTDGDTLWVARYDGEGHYEDSGMALAVDGSGNVCVTGDSYGSGGNCDYATIKYDSNGNQLWVSRYNGPWDRDDSASDLVTDSSGNVYVTGYSWDTNSVADFATVKYDANGNQLWATLYNGPRNIEDNARALSVDNAGNVYVTGSSWAIGPFSDYTTVKYDANGNELWAAHYDGPAASDDYAYSQAIDDSGNTYVTGHSYDSNTSWDYATIKYDANGNQLWVVRYDGPVNSDDGPTALAIDSLGNVYVTGESYDSSSSYDYATIKYAQVSCTEPIAGDLNNDSKVDFFDFAILSQDWLTEYEWEDLEVITDNWLEGT